MVKTARNSLYNSRKNGSKEMIDVQGRPIVWTDISDLYKRESHSMLSESLPKKVHVELTPYSKVTVTLSISVSKLSYLLVKQMNVGLARAVLNERVGKVLSKVPRAEGTADYILNFAKYVL